jgi:hypothetical protein
MDVAQLASWHPIGCLLTACLSCVQAAAAFLKHQWNTNITLEVYLNTLEKDTIVVLLFAVLYKT